MTDQPVSNEFPTRRRDPEARPLQILDAAFHEFGDRGLAGARLDDIARRAGVAKGTIYLYFPNKEALFREMVRSTVVDAIARGEATNAEAHPDDSAESMLRRLAAAWWAFLREERVMVLHRLVNAELRQFPDLMAFYAEEVIARGRRLVSGIVARGVERGEFRPCDPLVAARMYAALWMTHATWVNNRELHPTLGTDEHVLDEMLDFYLNALRPVAV
ncbi:MAG: TetR/AcrR family transcriptional regulator [Gemmatimonadaceae bacterium]|jgi:AcrR family transcriptional regulator|uniref:TetR/AcrR family transcriptional regulator n=1 Tax=Gemmatimonas sp. TaxID=1962908 RepID=UPI001DFACD27|nr:TetR/AcrR family transcriptional regulator [Gemmatimonas sp.]NCW44286.1 TetR/AcrR family transcriptional regulator [Gemmatimonadaceae bacterium]